MPFVPVANTALVELRFQLDGQQVENTLWIEKESAWGSGDLDGLASNIRDWWGGSMADLLGSQLTLSEVVATDMTTDTSGQSTIGGGDLHGNVEADILPSAMAACVAFHTSLRGRSFRGRNYVMSIPLSAVLGFNQLTTTFTAAVISAYTGLITAALPGTQHWVIASRFSGVDPVTHKPIPRESGLTTQVTNVVFTDNVLDTQRRRGPGRGR